MPVSSDSMQVHIRPLSLRRRNEVGEILANARFLATRCDIAFLLDKPKPVRGFLQGVTLNGQERKKERQGKH